MTNGQHAHCGIVSSSSNQLQSTHSVGDHTVQVLAQEASANKAEFEDTVCMDEDPYISDNPPPDFLFKANPCCTCDNYGC